MDWLTALSEFDVAHLRPRGGGGDAPAPGHVAFGSIGSLPDSAPAMALLVVVNDPDRDTDTGSVLRQIVRAAGARPLRILVATGSHVHTAPHRAAHEERLRADAPAAQIRWHDGALDVAYGDRRCDPWYAEARDIVGIGSVEPHWFAGLTGSYKTLSIGVLPREEIARSHSLATSDAARPFALAGNPVHEEMARTLHSLTLDKTVVGADLCGTWSSSRPREGLRWGWPLHNLRKLLPAARDRWGLAVPALLDFLVARVAAPLDRSLYQADKGIKNSEHAVRGGGAIVLEAACADGVGARRFVDLLAAAPDAAAARANVARDGYVLGDHKAIRIRALQERGVALALVAPGFPARDAAAVGIDVLADAAEAARWLRARVGPAARGAIVEDAGNAVVHVSA